MVGLSPDPGAADRELADRGPTTNLWKINDPNLDRGDREEAEVDPADRDPNLEALKVVPSQDPEGLPKLKFLYKKGDRSILQINNKLFPTDVCKMLYSTNKSQAHLFNCIRLCG